MSKIFNIIDPKTGNYISEYKNTHVSAKELEGDIQKYRSTFPVYKLTIKNKSIVGILVYCKEHNTTKQLDMMKESSWEQKNSYPLHTVFRVTPTYYTIRFLSGSSTYHDLILFNFEERIFEEVTGTDRYDNLSLSNEFKQFIVDTQPYMEVYNLQKDNLYSLNNINLGSFESSESLTFMKSNVHKIFPVCTFVKKGKSFKLILPQTETPTKLFKISLIKYKL